MSAINIIGFSGEQPRVSPRLLPAAGAKAAVNVRLDDGGLTPSLRAVQVAALPAANPATIYPLGDTWLSWPAVVHAVPGPVADDRLYYTGDGAPKLRIDGDVYDLAVPAPAAAPTVAIGGTGTGDVITRVYAYTWVTSFGEESEPSPATAGADWKPGQTVTLSGIEAPPVGRAITRQRFYRSQTAQSGTFLYFIAERDASNANFSDTVAVDGFAEPLPSGSWNPPPADLGGLVVLPNGMMAAFIGKDLYFSEPWHPHAWPEKYVLTTDYAIVALGAIGASLIVTTTGQPYLVTGSSPDVMQMVRIEANLPCINGRGVANLGSAVVFPSNDGLVAVRADGSIAMISGNLFNRDEWLRYAPASMIAAQHVGRYIGFYSTAADDGTIAKGGLIVDIAGTPFLSRTGVVVAAAFYDITRGALYYAPPDDANIYRFDDPSAARDSMYWRSKEFFLPAPDSMGIIQIDATDTLSGSEQAASAAHRAAVLAANAARIAAGSIRGDIAAAGIGGLSVAGSDLEPLPTVNGVLTVGVFADGRKVAQVSETNKPARLPAGFKASTWEIDVSGDLRVSRIALAKSIADLQQLPSA